MKCEQNECGKEAIVRVQTCGIPIVGYFCGYHAILKIASTWKTKQEPDDAEVTQVLGSIAGTMLKKIS